MVKDRIEEERETAKNECEGTDNEMELKCRRGSAEYEISMRCVAEGKF